MYKDLAKAKAFKLIEEGATREEVANCLGVSRRTVFRWLAARRALTESAPSPISCMRRKEGAAMNDIDNPYDPPKSGP